MADPVFSVPPTECKVPEGRSLTPCPSCFLSTGSSGTVAGTEKGFSYHP